jgi:hypothetical protein
MINSLGSGLGSGMEIMKGAITCTVPALIAWLDEELCSPELGKVIIEVLEE